MYFIWWIQLSIIGVIIKLQIIINFGLKIDETNLLVLSKILILLRVFQTEPSSLINQATWLELNGLGWTEQSFPKQCTCQRFLRVCYFRVRFRSLVLFWLSNWQNSILRLLQQVCPLSWQTQAIVVWSNLVYLLKICISEWIYSIPVFLEVTW